MRTLMCYNVFIILASEYIGGLLAILLPCRLIFPCTHCLGLHIRSSGPRCIAIIQAQVEQTSCTKFMLWTRFEPAVNGQSMGVPAVLHSCIPAVNGHSCNPACYGPACVRYFEHLNNNRHILTDYMVISHRCRHVLLTCYIILLLSNFCSAVVFSAQRINSSCCRSN